MDIEHLFQLIKAGGDTALIAIAWAIWRVERRVFALEVKLIDHMQKEDERL